MSVPALSGPAPQTPNTRQKTITELLTQWADLTNAAIAATGHPDGWFSGAMLDSHPWDPSAERVSIAPCLTRGPRDASQLQAIVTHDPLESDPHPIADKLTAYWKRQGFSVERTVDWADPTGGQSIEIRAERADGVQYGLTATNEQIGIDVWTECSTDPSIERWAEEGLRQRLSTLLPTPPATSAPSTPASKSPAAEGGDKDGWVW